MVIMIKWYKEQGTVCKVSPKNSPETIYAAKKIRLSGLDESEKNK
jgi:hypothetical protein